MAMPRRKLSSFIFAFMITLLAGTAAPALAQDVPQLMSHQGRLFDTENKPIIGVETITFRVYDAADDTGVVLWTETIDVALSNGYYSTTLGQTSAIPDTVFDGSTRFLGVTIGDETATEELNPRLEVTSVAYALKAGVAENATGALTPESITLGGGNTTLNADGSINAGGATIATDGTITLGAATINPDGSIGVGNTVIAADGSITVNSAPVIAADGSIDSSSISGTTLADLEAAGCTTGQLPQFDDTNGWGCFSPAAGTIYGAGSGLNIDASSVFSVDSTVVQTRIINSCNAGEAIQAINEDGSVICEVDDDTTYTAGAGVEVSSGVISLTDAIDDDTQYSAGTALTLDPSTNTFNVDQAQVEAWANGVDTDTTYSNGIGLDLNTGVFSVNQAQIEAWANGVDTVYSAGAGIDVSSGVISLIDATDDDTQYAAGTALTLDPSTNTFNVDQAQVEAWANGVDTDTTYVNGVGLDLTSGVFSVNQAQIEAWASGVDTDTTYSAGTGIVIDSGGVIALIDTTDDDTTYTSGNGLTLSAGQFAINDSIVQTDVEATAHAALAEVHHARFTNQEARDALTGADVLSKLVSVDGAGSGLDADSLDGIDSEALLPRGYSSSKPAASCSDALAAGIDRSGLVWIDLGGAPTELYCDQSTNGGGWALLYNSTLGTNSTEFWAILYADRFSRRGRASLDSNFYDGSLYLYGTSYMEVFEDLDGKSAVAYVATADSIDTDTMRFNNPALSSGLADSYSCQFAAGWSAPDYDGDDGSGNCAADYSAVTQHYCACWGYNLGSDADAPYYDAGVGPHVHLTHLDDLGLRNDGSAYSRVRRISRFVKW